MAGVGVGCMQMGLQGTLYLTVSLYKGYAMLLQGHKAKGYSHLGAE